MTMKTKPMTREQILESALNRLYMEALHAQGSHMDEVKPEYLRHALIHAAHVMGYHDMCEAICTERYQFDPAQAACESTHRGQSCVDVHPEN